MSETQAIPFWGPDQMEMYRLMIQAIDPEGRIPKALQELAPIEGRRLLDVGAGIGDRTIQYARLAEQVYALEPAASALPILRGRIKSSGAPNVNVVPAGAEAIPLDDGTVDVAYATWSYFFGPGSEAGLREVQRVVRPGGQLAIVQNYGHDELSRFWTSQEAECESWAPWFTAHGFSCHVVDSVWRFRTPDEALAVLEFLWGEPARVYVASRAQTEFDYKVAVYHRLVG
ncbi:MAG: methyltransferase domain-containing protein [Anaerolineae bacterium]|jgi:SAM-dependent methyltransferase